MLPFRNMAKIYGEKTSLRNPISGKVFVTGNIEQNAENLLTRLLISRVSNIEFYQLIPPEQAEGVIESIYEENVKEQDERHKIMQIGRRVGADVVIVGHVYRFEDTPAAFEDVKNYKNGIIKAVIQINKKASAV